MTKNLLKPIFVLLITASVFLSAHRALAVPLEYKALTSIPTISTAGQNVAVSGDLINNVYVTSIGIGSILAVIMITWSGIQYMVTGAVIAKTEAKSRIVAALGGLVLLLGAYLILKTINPALVNQDINLGNPSSVQNPVSGQGVPNPTTGIPPLTGDDCGDC